MILYKKYISLFLLAGFIFPQAANAMHYFIVPHASSVERGSINNYAGPGIYEYHDCNYHLTGTDSAFAINDSAEENTVRNWDFQEDNARSNEHTLQVHINYFLRGPPPVDQYFGTNSILNKNINTYT